MQVNRPMSLVKTEIQRRRRKPRSSAHTILGGNASVSNSSATEPSNSNSSATEPSNSNSSATEPSGSNPTGINSRGNNADWMTGEGQPNADDLHDLPTISSFSPPSAIVAAAVAAAANPSITWKD